MSSPFEFPPTNRFPSPPVSLVLPDILKGSYRQLSCTDFSFQFTKHKEIPGMEPKRHGCSVSVLSWLCLTLIFLVLLVALRLNEDQTFSASVFEGHGSVPIVELQTKLVTSDDRIHALDSGLSTDGALINRSRNSTTVTRKIRKRSREEEVEQGLARARASIRRAAVAQNFSSSTLSSLGDDVVLNGSSVYRNSKAFYQSYLEMKKRFKVHVYSEGDLPIVHDGPCKHIYTIEGRFIHEIEHGSTRFRTKYPEQAHVYFMPFSVTWMVKYIYKDLSYDHTSIKQFVADYVRVVSTKYPFWNRTQGADHFMLSCHDWGPIASQGNPHLYNTSIRVLCNANTSEGFNPQKDVSLPEIHLIGGNVSPKLLSPPPDHIARPYLAFFAGGLHGPIRPQLLHYWKDRDADIQVYEYLPKDLDYYSLMLQSKFCLCPSGHEVASPRIVEAIYAECVPVILSYNYALPFSDVLRWEAFSIEMNVSDIPRLKEVLSSIPEEKYRKLKEGVRAVRKHFMLNQPAKRFDVFHMILHSIWLRRINMKLG